MKQTKKNEEAYEAFLTFGTYEKAGEALGIPRSTIYDRCKAYEFETKMKSDSKPFSLPTEEEDDVDVEEIVDMLHKRFQRKKKHKESKKWIQIGVESNEPFGLLWLGDPHIDDNHCDWDTLKEHLSIINSHDRIFGCSLGDFQNNWIGRLSRLYGEQETSKKTALKLVEWLINNMKPMILIAGNHDMWSGAGDPLKWMAGHRAVMEDWEARIQLNFPNKTSIRIHAAHDMPGHSQWNPLHAQTKMAKFKSNADLYISGHRHNWALAQLEEVEQKKIMWLARARGFKYHDTYAFVKGFEQQNFGQSIMQVIDPRTDDPFLRHQCFPCPRVGLQWLRLLEARPK